jgi:hypothetical protein
MFVLRGQKVTVSLGPETCVLVRLPWPKSAAQIFAAIHEDLYRLSLHPFERELFCFICSVKNRIRTMTG